MDNETTAIASEHFVILINKKRVKQIVAVAAAIAAVTGVVYVARNLSVETTEDSVTVELETP